MICNCIAKYCDPVNGCERSTTDWDSKMLTTDLLESEDIVAKICKKGYNGTNCETRCLYPSYGLGCQNQCNCIDKDCDHVSGCMQSAKDHPTSIDFQHITAMDEYMESEYNIINCKEKLL
uniref:Uncharacterized protein n=1 Tax=Magallana gigas TaxID=29159 RepID=A0A8W8M4S8_MAGGI